MDLALFHSDNACYNQYMQWNVPYDTFRHFDIDCLFDVVFVSVVDGYGGAGIGRRLIEYSETVAQWLKCGEREEILGENLRRLGRRPQAIEAIFTSTFTQRIGKRLGYEAMAERRYVDCVYGGVTFAERLADPQHTGAVLMAKRL